MRIGLYYHIPGRFSAPMLASVPSYFGRFVHALAEAAGSVTAFLHETDALGQADYLLSPPLVRVVNLGPKGSAPSRTFFPNRVLDLITPHFPDLDVLLIRGPSPLLPALAKVAQPLLPTVLLLVGEYLRGVDDLPQPKWRKELIRVWSRVNLMQQERVARGCLVLVNSASLAQSMEGHAAELQFIKTTTLGDEDFFERADTCLKPPVRLFYAGRLDRQKGLEDVVAAMGLLEGRGLAVELGIAGWEDSQDLVLDRVFDLAHKIGLRDKVSYHGFRQVGEDLFSLYRQADIFVTASRGWEGFPRTIWEAMAQSLPVVATRVGGVPSMLRDGVTAALAEPRNPESLAKAIERLSIDGSLRRKLIAEGLALAKTNTLEVSSAQMVGYLRAWREKVAPCPA